MTTRKPAAAPVGLHGPWRLAPHAASWGRARQRPKGAGRCGCNACSDGESFSDLRRTLRTLLQRLRGPLPCGGCLRTVFLAVLLARGSGSGGVIDACQAGSAAPPLCAPVHPPLGRGWRKACQACGGGRWCCPPWQGGGFAGAGCLAAQPARAVVATCARRWAEFAHWQVCSRGRAV